MALELYDKQFLLDLDKYPHREVYCRVIALNWNEDPVAEVTSNVVSGSITVDGSSTVRRTANLSMVTGDLKVDTIIWRVQTKIKILVGLRNYLKDLPQDEITERYKDYDEIIWFPQGTFVITSFNSSFNTQGYTINISAKDKMCLLNGDISGNLWASHDFSQLYTTQSDGSEIKTYIPIYNIIKEAVHTYAREPYSNIIINDLDGCGVELLEYISSNATMYIFKQSLNAGQQGELWTYQIAFDTSSPTLTGLLEQAIAQNGGVDEGARLYNNGVTYVVQKRISTSSVDKVAGYRATEITYPGELVIAVGGTITELLNKITSLLGEFEYYYDLEGHFVFQRKKIYINTVWTNAVTNENLTYYESMNTATDLAYDFVQGILVNTFTNTPTLSSIKNDYSIWGKRKTATGQELHIHLRYAIDNKPKIYYSLRNKKTYISTELNRFMNSGSPQGMGMYDWRELIYQMAYDNLYAETAIASLKLALSKGYYHYDDSKCIWNNTSIYYKYDSSIKDFVRITGANELKSCLYHQIFIFGTDSSKTTLRLTSEQKAKISEAIGGDYGLYQLGEIWFGKVITEELRHTVNTLVTQYTVSNARDMVAEEIKEWQQTYNTGYESYYTDILGFWRYMYKVEPDFTIDQDENDPYLLRGYTLQDWAVNSMGETVLTYVNENGDSMAVYHGSDEIDMTTWAQEWQTNGFWNPNLFAYNRNTANVQIKEPTALYFWLDFCDADSGLGELQQYRVDVAGRRSKYVNDNDVKAIYFRETPSLLFVSPDYDIKPGEENLNYCHINIAPPISNYFKISSQGKSAKEVLDSLLYENTYAQESIQMQCIPIYYLEPNTRIRVFDDSTNINGEYLIKSFTIPLQYDGFMSITANRAVERIL